MFFRKTRTHFQGASNRSSDRLSDSNANFTMYRSSKNLKQSTPTFEIKNPFTSSIKKRSQRYKNFNRTSQNFHKQSLSYQGEDLEVRTVEQRLRKIFKNSKDMVKLLNHWGFDQKGYISKDQFHRVVNKKIGEEVDEKNVEMLMQKHSSSQQCMDSQGLISMLMGTAEGIPIDNMNLPIQHNNPCRQVLVDNLKEDVRKFQKNTNTDISDQNINRLLAKFNTGVSRMRQSDNCHIPQDKNQFFAHLRTLNNFNSFQHQLLNHIEKTVNFGQMQALLQRHKNADYLFVDPIVRNTCVDVSKDTIIKAELKRKQHFMTESDMEGNFADKMKSLPNLLKRTLRSQEKRSPFDPISFLNIDQRKTRFQRSQFTAEGSGWFANTLTQSVKPDQKDKVLTTLKEEAALKQARYENKLQKMRINRQVEQENIFQREEGSKQRQAGHLQRIRDQQQAYNYINFIKKRWE